MERRTPTRQPRAFHCLGIERIERDLRLNLSKNILRPQPIGMAFQKLEGEFQQSDAAIRGRWLRHRFLPPFPLYPLAYRGFRQSKVYTLAVPLPETSY